METRGVTAALLCSSRVMSSTKTLLWVVRPWRESTTPQESQQPGTGVRTGLLPTLAGRLLQGGSVGHAVL